VVCCRPQHPLMARLVLSGSFYSIGWVFRLPVLSLLECELCLLWPEREGNRLWPHTCCWTAVVMRC
jgi:hypothetical protein